MAVSLWHVGDPACCRCRVHTSPGGMQEALPGLLQDTHITALVQGNFTAQDAFEMASSVRKALSHGILLASERSADRVVVLPTGTLLHR